jgi:hypothetical protein
MPSKNKKQLNFFLLVKAYKENGEIGVKRQFNHLEGYKPRLTVDYMKKLIKTANTIQPADLIDMTSGIEDDNTLGDKRDLKVGYWALFRGKFKPASSINEIPQEGEFVAQIKRVDNSKGVVNFNQNGFRNKYGNTMVIPRRANVSNPDFIYLDYALFNNVIKTGKTPQEVAKQKEALTESIELKSKSHKGNRLFDMLKTAKFQHYDSPKGELSTLNRGEEDRKRIVSKLSSSDKKTYREWLKTTEGQKSLKRFEDFTSPLFKEKANVEEAIRKSIRKILEENFSGQLPLKNFSKVYHIGSMDIKNKSNFSLEGSGLSVSIHPREWSQIARLGGNAIFELVKSNGVFADAYKMNKEHKKTIINWALTNGYLIQKETYKVCWFDDDLEHTVCMEFDNLKKAKDELGNKDEGRELKINKKGLLPTEKLKQETQQQAIDPSQTFDLLLTIYVENTSNYDGVWWSDKLDPLNYSAPRGVIFNKMVNSWNAKKIQD